MIEKTTLTIRARGMNPEAPNRTTNLFSTPHIKNEATNENVLDLAEAIQALQSVTGGEQEFLKSTQFIVTN